MKHIFVIGTSSIPGEFILPRLLSAIVARVPDIELRVDIANSLQVFERVRKGEYSIGVIGTTYPSPDVEYQTIVAADRLVVIAPSDHPLAGRGGILPAGLKGHSFITREKGSGTRATYEQAFRDAGLAMKDLKAIAEVSSAEGVVKAVAAGAGIAVVSELVARDAAAKGTVCVLDIPLLRMERAFSIITSKQRELSEEAKKVIAIISSALHEP
jgi:DNA-binding transcriptional LysR family regulator